MKINKDPWQQVLETCRTLLPPGTRVTAACSGGADSMALLLFLYQNQGDLGISLEALHIDHGFRAASPQEAAYVQQVCRELEIPFHMVQLRQECPDWRPNASEEWARNARYRIYRRFVGPGAVVATAHTLSDQAETLLLRMARGTGLHGLGGIPAWNQGIVRPLLGVTRAQTQDYCRRQNRQWVEDESNHTDQYARNRVRRQVIPGLETVNPQAQQALAALAGQMEELDRYFAQKAKQLLQQAWNQEGYSLQVLNAADLPILKEALRRIIRRYRDPNRELLERACQAVAHRGTVQLTGHLLLDARRNILAVWDPQAAPPAPIQLHKADLNQKQKLHLGGYTLGLEVINCEKMQKVAAKNDFVHKKDYIFLADYAKIPCDLVLRTRQPGDRFCHPVRGQTKTLKKWDNELGLAAAQRLRPLLAGEGQVIWIWGQGTAKGYLPQKETGKVLVITQELKGEPEGICRTISGIFWSANLS